MPSVHASSYLVVKRLKGMLHKLRIREEVVLAFRASSLEYAKKVLARDKNRHEAENPGYEYLLYVEVPTQEKTSPVPPGSYTLETLPPLSDGARRLLEEIYDEIESRKKQEGRLDESS